MFWLVKSYDFTSQNAILTTLTVTTRGDKIVNLKFFLENKFYIYIFGIFIILNLIYLSSFFLIFFLFFFTFVFKYYFLFFMHWIFITHLYYYFCSYLYYFVIYVFIYFLTFFLKKYYTKTKQMMFHSRNCNIILFFCYIKN